MRTKYYFAYGSNMNLDQMEKRCPGAKPIAQGFLDGYELAFHRRYLDIVPREGGVVWGVIWEISKENEIALDFYEGYPEFYIKENVNIMVPSEGYEVEDALVYIMAPQHKNPQPPTEDYLNGVLLGCQQNEITEDYVKRAYRDSLEWAIDKIVTEL